MFNLLMASLLSSIMGAPLVIALAVSAVVSLLPGLPQNAFGMALQVEVWEKDIVGNLFADNSFLSKAYNADMYVLAGKVVHIPQAGAASGVVKNRTDLPATVVKRADAEVTYALDEYTTNPTLIEDAATVELSYSKRNSVIMEDKASLMQSVAQEFIYKWSPTVAISQLRTNGAAVEAHLPDATGYRMAMTLEKVNEAASIMNARDIPQEGRYALIDSKMYDQLIAQMSANAHRDFLSGLDPLRGVIGKYGGFDFYMRSTAARYDNATLPVPIAPGTDGEATDNAAAIFWQENSVERALGQVKAFDKSQDPQFYGDVLSFLIRAGGRIRKSTQYGVVAVIQAATTVPEE